EGASALLALGGVGDGLEAGEHGAHVLGGNAGGLGDLGDQARLAEHFLDRLDRDRLLGGGLLGGLRGSLLLRSFLGSHFLWFPSVGFIGWLGCLGTPP